MTELGGRLPDVATIQEPPLRRRRRLQNMMLTATVFFVAVACSGNKPETAPKTQAPATAPHVVFYAEGQGTVSGSITLRTESGGTVQKDVALPMTDTATGTAGVSSFLFKRGASLYISVQNKAAAGSVTCRIEVDGKEIDKATSSGAYKIASCVGKVP